MVDTSMKEACAKRRVCITAVKPFSGADPGVIWAAAARSSEADSATVTAHADSGWLKARLRVGDTLLSVHGLCISAGVTSGRAASAALEELDAGPCILCIERQDSRAFDRWEKGIERLPELLAFDSSVCASPSPRSERRELTDVNRHFECVAPTEFPARLTKDRVRAVCQIMDAGAIRI